MNYSEVVDAFTSLVLSHDVAVPVAAMHALVLSIERSDASTWMELEDELRSAIAALKRCKHEDLGGRTSLSLGSGCDLFMKYVTRAFNEETGVMEFADCKQELLRRGEKFAGMSLSSRSRIADIGDSFITDSCTVLVHGNSRVVNALILKAATSKHFNVLITEGRPGNASNDVAQLFLRSGIPTKMILDCAVGSFIDQVDMVLVGAEGVMENGGIVNKTGTYQIAVVARALKKPVYVAVESYKFARMYPLTQRDIFDLCAAEEVDVDSDDDEAPDMPIMSAAIRNVRNSSTDSIFNSTPPPLQKTTSGENFIVDKSNSSVVESWIMGSNSPTPKGPTGSIGDGSSDDVAAPCAHMLIDFTPAEFITLLFTDLGVLTPAAVSDELIRLYA